jgi:hypothetical protein
MNRITHGLVTVAFSFACLCLWSLLSVLGKTSAASGFALPAFTRFCIGLSPLLLMLPVPVVGYCLYALFCRPQSEQAGATFLAWTMSALCLVFFPVLIALFLPCLKLMGG